MPGKIGLGLGGTIMSSSSPAVTIDDYLWDLVSAHNLQPLASGTVSDFHDTWDLTNTVDYMPEASPDDEGYWDDMPELITNGQFDTDSDWNRTNTTIGSSGVLNFASSGLAKFAFQDNVVEAGSSYVIKLTVVRASGTLSVLFGTGGSGVSGISNITASGTYTFTTPPLTSTEAGSGRFWAGYTGASDNFVGTVDNVSVTEYAIRPLDV